jgi:antitoxin component YwqK of YwqJK toxin-antitoxin module
MVRLCSYDADGTMQEFEVPLAFSHPVYVGAHKGNDRHGFGKEYFSIDDAEMILHYEGDWCDGVKHGWGKEYFHDGVLSYEGEWRNGKYAGRGKSYNTFGVVTYDGEWKNGLCHGNGRGYTSGGTLSYTGEFKFGSFAGEGTLWNTSGPVKGTVSHVGEFSKGVKHGFGVTLPVTLCSHGIPEQALAESHYGYVGEFREGLRNGEGKLFVTMHDRSIVLFKGMWTLGERYGVCKEFSLAPPHLCIYDGFHVHGVRHGRGSEYDLEGRILYDGLWKDGTRDGQGTAFHPDGTVAYEGAWSFNLRHGPGKAFKRGGSGVREGVWVKDSFSACLTEKRKRVAMEREQILKVASDCVELTPLSQCVICFTPMLACDVTFAYIPCGHRVVCGACQPKMHQAHRNTCIVCRSEAAKLLRIR